MADTSTEKNGSKTDQFLQSHEQGHCIRISPSNTKPKQRATRSYHAKSLIQLSCRTNLYQNSFFQKTIRDWNALPERAAMASSSEAFAAVLKEYTADSEH